MPTMNHVSLIWSRSAGAGNVVAASAEGYAFPTTLDRDAPVGGMAPQTCAGLG